MDVEARRQMRAVTWIAFVMSAQAQVPTDPAQVRPLAVGVHAPLFFGTRTDGAVRVFKPGGYARPAIVIFYRGIPSLRSL